MSFNKGHRKYHGKHGYSGNRAKVGDKGREVLESLDETNPVLMMFKEYATSLDEKHDRYERIVKINRDITIESKRIIFLLHNSDTDVESKREQVLKEAGDRLNQLITNHFKTIAVELEGHDHYLYQRAYSAGLQEFIEALVFHQYLSKNDIDNWETIHKQFRFKVTNSSATPVEAEDNTTSSVATVTDRDVNLLFSPVDFILGIADFTGELMRKCINNLGSGKIEDCFKICAYVKFIHCGFLGIHNSGYKEIGRKLYVLRQSLSKMELVCYNIRVRGSEVPKHMLAIVATQPQDGNTEDDEGYY